MTKVAIFASGSGSNFENIVSKVDKGHLNNIEITFYIQIITMLIALSVQNS